MEVELSFQAAPVKGGKMRVIHTLRTVLKLGDAVDDVSQMRRMRDWVLTTTSQAKLIMTPQAYAIQPSTVRIKRKSGYGNSRDEEEESRPQKKRAVEGHMAGQSSTSQA